MKLKVEGGFVDSRVSQIKFINNDNLVYCKLIGSSTCCGVHEFGSFQKINNTQEIKDAIKDAFNSTTLGKGVIYSYLPKDLSPVELEWMKTWREILLLIGFQEEKEFYNPNSGHSVIQYVLTSYEWDSE